VELFVLGVVVALVVVGLVVAVAQRRRTPTVGQGEMPGGQDLRGRDPLGHKPAEAEGGAQAKPGIRVSKTVITKRVVVARSGSAGSPATGVSQTYHSVDDIPDQALREQIRTALADGSTSSESVVVDGKTYHSLADIPDPGTRDRLRAALESAAGDAKDPALGAVLREELDELEAGPPSPRAPTDSTGEPR
jgi:hypothetical protein